MSALAPTASLYAFQLPNGETVRLTSREALAQYGISPSTFLASAKKIGKTVQNFERWLKRKRLASVSHQPAKVSSAAGVSLLILWDYQNRQNPRYKNGKVGVKWLAKKYGYSNNAITQLLIDHGINPSLRSTNMVAKCSPKEAARIFYQQKTKLDIPTMLRRRVMNRIQHAIKGRLVNATGSFKFVGCAAEELKKHIESKFDSGMKWENYGTYWEIDHIRPCASFDLTDREQFAQCFHYSNLQPLPVSVNRSKKDKWNG
jgi:hypothetical protein